MAGRQLAMIAFSLKMRALEEPTGAADALT